jgi:hypothetical protein
MSARKDMAIWVAIVALTTGAGLVSGSHRSGCWKYADGAINWFNGGTGDYWNIFNEEAKADSDAWDPYTDVQLTPVSAAGSSDHLSAYNGSYGSTGWLAITEIQSYTGCTIKAGRFRLNQTYLDSGSYSRNVKNALACNKIGSLLGLSTDNTRNGCMNSSLAYSYPSTHDRDVINSIY